MAQLRSIALIVGDILILYISYIVCSFFVVAGDIESYYLFYIFLTDDFGLLKITAVVASLVFGIYWVGLYENIRVRSRRILFEKLLLVFGSTFLFQAILGYIYRPAITSRMILIFGSVLAFSFLQLWRSVYTMMLLTYAGRQRVVLVGKSPLAQGVANHINLHPELGYELLGILDLDLTGTIEVDQYRELDAGFSQWMKQLRVDRICIAGELPQNDLILTELLNCSMHGIIVEGVGQIYEELHQQVALELITMNQLIFSNSFRPAAWVLSVQSILNRILAVAGIIVSSPFMLLTALAVRLDSPGPVLLRQQRVGQNGKPFVIYKFRSMYVDADARFGRRRADESDPRITKVGRFIRLLRLDELPQFFNVLEGTMNIVGPRPEMPVYVRELSEKIPLYPQRLRVKPGITGWAQLHHQPELTETETRQKLQYDLYYIKNMSLALDFLILFHTVRTILMRVGAR